MAEATNWDNPVLDLISDPVVALLVGLIGTCVVGRFRVGQARVETAMVRASSIAVLAPTRVAGTVARDALALTATVAVVVALVPLAEARVADSAVAAVTPTLRTSQCGGWGGSCGSPLSTQDRVTPDLGGACMSGAPPGKGTWLSPSRGGGMVLADPCPDVVVRAGVSMGAVRGVRDPGQVC
ncbi:hypothetical protein [Streptomyces sp. NPDC057681]|uniref:hypothetical protein n=1 Tax=unclassified Streptomyces TaxID=2593676 RepID=UPI0036951F1D